MNREVFWSVVTLIGVISVTYSFVTLSSIPGAYPDMTSFMDEYLRSVIGDFIDAIVILYLCTLFIVIRFSKKSLLLLSVYASALIAVALFFPTAINKCGYGTCVFDSVFFQLMFLVVTLLALLAAIFYFLHESTFKKWFKFSIFYVPTAAFLYAISPGDDGGWLAISTAGIVAVCSLMGFVAATVILILYHSYKMSGKEFMRAIAVLSMVAIGSYFIALKNNIF